MRLLLFAFLILPVYGCTDDDAPDAADRLAVLQDPSLVLRQGMPYAEAREALLGAGWQAVVPRWQDRAWTQGGVDGGRTQEIAEALGWGEVENCSGTGMAFCLFVFSNAEGGRLRVTTSGEGTRDIIVDSWGISDGEPVGQASAAESSPPDLPGAEAIPEDQRAALARYLNDNPGYVFIKPDVFEPLTWMRAEPYFGASFNPYYRAGDFNQDGEGDFAVVVAGPDGNGDQGASATFVRVFNGVGGGAYTLAHQESEALPFEAFVHVPPEGGKLFYGIAETGYAVTLVPAGNGYLAESSGQ